MRYSGIIYNDISAAPGISLSFFTQGCPLRCSHCHNPQTWDFDGGYEFTQETMEHIIKGLKANGIKRSFAIMGGEPLCPENRFLVDLVIKNVKQELPDCKIYVWTGYLYENLRKDSDPRLKAILDEIDCLIDGPYIHEERDITLPMCGSRNQRVLYLKEK